MKNRMIAGFAILGLGASVAQASDRPLPGAVPVLAEGFRWTGVHAGVQAGFGEGKATGTLEGVGSATARLRGGFGGAHLGASYQNELLVVGVEVDAEASGLSRSYRVLNATTNLRSTWMASARGRFGLAYDQLLIYVTGGIAVTDGGYKTSAPSLGIYESASRTFYGATFGAGVEYAFSRNFSMRAEWRGTNFQTRKFSISGPDDVAIKLSSNLVRVGASYRF